MKKVVSIVIAVALASVAGLSPVAAQNPGEPIVHASNGSGTYVMRANLANNSLSTILVGVNQQSHTITGVQMASDNMRIVFAANAKATGSNYVGVYDPGTQTTTTLVASTTVRFNTLVPGQNGGYFTYDNRTIHYISPGGMLSTVRANLPAVISAVGLDVVSAAILVGSQAGHLWTVSQNGQSMSTVATGLGNVRSVDCSAQTGNYLVTTNVAPQLRVLSRVGALLFFFTLANINAAWIDQATGHVWMAEAYKIFQMTAALVVIKSWSWANPSLAMFSIMHYAWRVVAGQSVLTPGNPFFLSFYFPQLAGAAYIAALSLATRPGIRLGGGRRLNLAADALFFAVVLNSLFVSNFSGVLNAQGGAMGSVTIPAAAAGVLIYVSVIAILNSKIYIGNTMPMMC